MMGEPTVAVSSHGAIPSNSVRLLFSHGRLLWRVTRNELSARYAGSLLGTGWVILYPLVVIGIYAAVYLLIFRVNVAGLTSAQYVLHVIAGLSPFLMTSEALSSGVSSIMANKFVLNSTVFPVDLVPPKAVLTSQGPMVAGLIVVVLWGLATETVAWTLLLFPVIWALYLLALTGLVWVLSLLNVVLRDLQNLTGLTLMVLLIASPIGYTPDMVPRALRLLLLINPFAYFVTAFQDISVYGHLPGPWHWGVLIVLSLGSFGLGGWFFARGKRAVIDYV